VLQLNEDLLTLKPQKLDLTVPENRDFVLSPSQVESDGSISITFSGTQMILGTSASEPGAEFSEAVTGAFFNADSGG
jgi:hypothetical protein